VNRSNDTSLAPSASPTAALPPGWRDADETPDVDVWRLARRRRRIVITSVVVVVLLLEAAGVVIWNAQSHYGRGQSALAAGADALAAEEFSQATLLGLPYRDAAALETQARASMAADIEEREAEAARYDTVFKRLDRAAAALRSGDPDDVLAASRAAGKAGLAELAADSPRVADAQRELLGGVVVATRKALADARWRDAGVLAAAAIALDGARDEWTALARRAEKGDELATVVERAREAADRGSWRTALRLAQQVLAERSEFPGAARVAERARAALSAAQARAAAAAADESPAGSGQTAPTSTGSGGGTTTQPPPP
jgi:hypothetical protein